MEISLGEYDLVHSGIIIQIKGMPIKIKIKDEVEGDFTFLINFVSDTTDKASKSNFTPIDKFTVQVDLKNFNHFQNGGNTELVEIGTLREKPLFFNYRVFDLTNVGMTFIFNFYTMEGVKHG
ncbi:MAG: DUF6864 domain-containing function [Flavobacterium sp.]